ncbi:MAG TPA: sugar transferase [Anaerolineales bacterium]|nr:sugar transferase [Anaerolineales bacterium]
MNRITSWLDGSAKRLLDIVMGGLGLLLFTPLFFFVIVILKRDTPGPIFYHGKRVGKGGVEFDILKFRTMYNTEESFAGPRLTAHDDPRVTPFGNWLRATKVNELPQLWNVLKGDMSLVGPRPEDPTLAAEWPPDVRAVLLSVRPGITSPASVVFRNLDKLLQSDRVVDEYLQTILPSKMRFDMLYVRNRTILMDLDILFWTLIGLLPPMRKTKVPESQLFWGPLSSFMTNDFRWFLVDFPVALGSIAFVGGIWRTIAPLRLGWFWAPLIALEMAVIFGLANAFLGLNKIFWSRARPSDAVDLAFSTGVSIGLLLLIDVLFIRQPEVPIALYIFSGAFSFVGFLAVRYRERLLTGVASRWIWMRAGRHSLGERLLIVGGGELGEFGVWLVRKGDLTRAFQIVGMVDDDPKKQGMRIDGIKVIGTTQEIEQLVTDFDIGVVFFAIANIGGAERERILQTLERTSAKLVFIPNVVQMMRTYFDRNPAGLMIPPDSEENLTMRTLDAWLVEVELMLAYGEIQTATEQIHRIRGQFFRSGKYAELYDQVLAE